MTTIGYLLILFMCIGSWLAGGGTELRPVLVLGSGNAGIWTLVVMA
jgi:hypothetical protein